MVERSWWLELVVHPMHAVRGLATSAVNPSLIDGCHPASPSGLKGMPLGGGLTTVVQQGVLERLHSCVCWHHQRLVLRVRVFEVDEASRASPSSHPSSGTDDHHGEHECCLLALTSLTAVNVISGKKDHIK